MNVIIHNLAPIVGFLGWSGCWLEALRRTVKSEAAKRHLTEGNQS